MKLKYEFVINNVAGETIAVSVGNTQGGFNGYIKLNDTAAFIFEHLKKDTSREELINAVLKNFSDANEKDATDSVDELINSLNKADLLL